MKKVLLFLILAISINGLLLAEKPFSWYAPYSYEYYYPRKSFNGAPRDYCEWIYTQQGYVYKCY